MILGILQARVSSTRLPGKVLRPILGKPMLIRQIERILQTCCMDKLIVATSVNTEDDAIEEVCNAIGIDCYRGSLEDVLDRFYQAAKNFEPEHVIRLTGDCPLADSEVIDQLIEFHIKGDYDYSSNALEPTYPDGLDVEAIRFSALESAWKNAKIPSAREHVTLYLYQNPQMFRIGVLKNTVNLSYLRWTVDEPQDLEVVNQIYESLYPKNPQFTTWDILQYLEEDVDLKTKNTAFERNEGLKKSLNKDK
jgi:spore coat polysaccharide biosynthesis protein SpsF